MKNAAPRLSCPTRTSAAFARKTPTRSTIAALFAGSFALIPSTLMQGCTNHAASNQPISSSTSSFGYSESQNKTAQSHIVDAMNQAPAEQSGASHVTAVEFQPTSASGDKAHFTKAPSSTPANIGAQAMWSAQATSKPQSGFDQRTLVFTGESPSANAMNDTPEGLAQVSFANDGSDFDPAVSRDGQWLAFASTQHRPTADIYIQRTGSRAVKQLTADPANDVMPVIASDGKRIAFSSDRLAGANNGQWAVYMMSTQGGAAVRLTDGPMDLHPTFSPDGSKLAFSRLGQTSGRWELWVIDVARPSQAEFLGFGMFPEWSPIASTGEDGADKIVFQRGRERGMREFSIWTVDYKPGFVSSPTEIVGVNNGPGGIAAVINPHWSPDGKFIAYSVVRENGAAPAEVWLTASDGSAQVQLAGGSGIGSGQSPTWSKDGRVFFVSDRAGREQIWSMNTQRAMLALGASPASDLAKAPSPAARTIAAQGQFAPTMNPEDPIDVTDPDPMATVPTP